MHSPVQNASVWEICYFLVCVFRFVSFLEFEFACVHQSGLIKLLAFLIHDGVIDRRHHTGLSFLVFFFVVTNNGSSLREGLFGS